jgi:hypothetical protein
MEVANEFQSILCLWAFGVGSSIGGNFFGYQPMLKAGFIPALVIVSLCSLIFLGVGFAISELTKRLNGCKNGTAGRVSLILGPTWGKFSACVSLLKCHNVLCALVVGTTGYVMSLFDLPSHWQYILYASLYLLYFFINCQGTEISSYQQIVITIFCIIALLVYYGIAGSNVDIYANALHPHSTLIGSTKDILQAFPFGCTLFLGFEEIPLMVTSSVYTADVVQKIHSSMLYSYLTLTLFGYVTVLMSTSAYPGLIAVSESNVPLLEGVNSATNPHESASVHSLRPYHELLVVAISASSVVVLGCATICFMMCTARGIEHLSGIGWLPQWVKGPKYVPSSFSVKKYTSSMSNPSKYPSTSFNSKQSPEKDLLLAQNALPLNYDDMRESFSDRLKARTSSLGVIITTKGVPYRSLCIACFCGIIQCIAFGFIFDISKAYVWHL